MVLEKLFKNDNIKKYQEDEELLEDVIVENKQAIEMANIYSGILSGMMDAFASVISNNLNVVMKVLAIITAVLSVPTMIFSAYGMNVAAKGMPFAPQPWLPSSASTTAKREGTGAGTEDCYHAIANEFSEQYHHNYSITSYSSRGIER